MADWISTANGLISLITALASLVGMGITAFFAIKNFIKATKERSFKENWAMIMEIADGAMKEAEKQTLEGADKKKLVIETVKAACLSAGIDVNVFLDQLSAYIDETIKFVNEMKVKKVTKKAN